MPWGNYGPYFFKLVINPADEAYDDAMRFDEYMQVECSILFGIDREYQVRRINADGTASRILGGSFHSAPWRSVIFDESKVRVQDSLAGKNEGCWVKIGSDLRRMKKGEYQALCDEFRSFLMSELTKRS